MKGMSGLFSGSDEQQHRGFRRIVLSLIALVIVPTAALLVVGILMLVFYEARLNILFGILVMSLVVCLVTGAVLALVFVRQEAKLSRLQLDFVSKVSHELRTPLTSIRMFAETLRYEQDQERIDTCLTVLQAETARLSDRIERLLDWGRMEAGRRVYERRTSDVQRVVDGAVTAFRSHMLDRPRELEVDVEAGLPSIWVDQAALADALLNLLANANKYSPPDSPIQLSVARHRGEVWFAVRDHGIGIAGQEHKRIFEKFYRADDRLSRTVEGSGLGLSIVEHVVAAHDGSVDVKSAPGEGSTFTIRLPLRSQEHSAAAPALSSTPTR